MFFNTFYNSLFLGLEHNCMSNMYMYVFMLIKVTARRKFIGGGRYPLKICIFFFFGLKSWLFTTNSIFLPRVLFTPPNLTFWSRIFFHYSYFLNAKHLESNSRISNFWKCCLSAPHLMNIHEYFWRISYWWLASTRAG